MLARQASSLGFFLRLYTPLSNLGPAQLESRASHECAEALPVRDPAGPTPTHRHGPTISHKAATCLSSTPSPSSPTIPTLSLPSCSNASRVHLMWGRPPCLGTRAHQLDRSIGGCCDRRRATSRGGRASVYALASTGVGRARQVLCSFVASTCLRPCCLCCWSDALRQCTLAVACR